MTDPITRRRLLAATGAATLAPSGCLGSTNVPDDGGGGSQGSTATRTTATTDAGIDPTPPADIQGWPQAHRDPANTGHNPNATGPGGTVGQAWTLTDDIGWVVSDPAVAGDRVYVGTHERNVHSIEISSGRRDWTAGLSYTAVSTVAVGQEYLIAAAEHVVGEKSLYGLSPEDGIREWATTIKGVDGASPTYVDGIVFIAGEESPSHDGVKRGGVYAIDERDGTVRWSYDVENKVKATPAYADGIVYAVTTNGRVVALDALSGEHQWEQFVDERVRVAPSVADGRLFVGTVEGEEGGRVFALDAATGEELWQYQAGKNVEGSPSVHDGTVYVVSEFRGGAVHGIDAATGTRRWRIETRGKLGGSPSIASGTVYVAGDPFLYAIDAESGEVDWKFEGVKRGTPAVVGETLYVGRMALETDTD